MINVLLVTGSLHIGGMESVAMNIVRYSDRNKFHFDFVVYGQDEYENVPEAVALGCNVFRIPFPHESLRAFKRELRKVLKEDGPYDIVHCHNLFNCGIVAKVGYEEKIPVRISHSHTNRLKKHKSYIHRLYEGYMRILMRRYSTDFYACSEKAGEYLFGDLFTRVGYVLSNGIDISKFEIDTDIVANVRSKIADKNQKILLQVGTMSRVKNQLFTLQLFQQLIKTDDSVILAFAGDGSIRSEIEDYIKQNGLTQKVKLLGIRNDVNVLMLASDALIMPSLYEGVSLVLIEAQASGIPIVASKGAYTEETHVTENVISLSLDCEARKWVSALEKALYMPHKKKYKQAIIDKGYSIQNNIAALDKKYMEAVSRNKER